MRVVKGLLFVHPSMGLGVVTSLAGTSASVCFEEYPGKSYLIALNYIKTVYSFNAVQEKVKSVRDIIRKDLLDGFFTAANRAKGHDIFNKNDAIFIFEERDDVITANIIGTQAYETSIKYVDGVISMSCDCPVNGYCKHLFALIDYVKHRDDFSAINVLDSEVLKKEVNPELEKLLSIDSPYNYTFTYLDNVRNILNRLINDFSAEDIVQYFVKHQEITTLAQQLHYRICFINNELYEKITVYLVNNPEYKVNSIFLHALEKNHSLFFESINSRYYVSDILRRRDNHILYACFNNNFVEAADILPEPSFYPNSRVVIAYFLEDIFKDNPTMVKDYVKNVFYDDFDTIYQTYNRSNDEKLQKIIYLSFLEKFRNLNIFRDDIESIDIINQTMNKKQKMSSKQREEFLRLVDDAIKNGHEDEIVAIVFNDWISSRNALLDQYLREEIISRVSDNELLVKILKAKRGYYDYH